MREFILENGHAMPALGLGTWKSAKGEVYTAIRQAIEIGYRHFDCAHLYMNEGEIGNAFHDALLAGDCLREDLFITSKLWNNRHRLEQVKPAFEISLGNLKLDYLDLYLIHWPVVVADHVDLPANANQLVSLSQTPLAETWQGMIQLVESKAVKHIGVSNFNASKIQDVWDKTGVKPEVNQVEMHPFMQQKPLKAYCDIHNILLTAYAPLGSADRPAARITPGEPNLFHNETIKSIAQNREISEAQVMLAWAVNYGVSVIPKSVNPERLKQNLEAADIVFEKTEMAALAAIDLNNRYIKGDFWCLPGSDYTLESLWEQ